MELIDVIWKCTQKDLNSCKYIAIYNNFPTYLIPNCLKEIINFYELELYMSIHLSMDGIIQNSRFYFFYNDYVKVNLNQKDRENAIKDFIKYISIYNGILPDAYNSFTNTYMDYEEWNNTKNTLIKIRRERERYE